VEGGRGGEEEEGGAPPPAPRRGDRSVDRDRGVGAEEGTRQDIYARGKERSRNADVVHDYTAPPVFPQAGHD
jgi:hypothetical protein